MNQWGWPEWVLLGLGLLTLFYVWLVGRGHEKSKEINRSNVRDLHAKVDNLAEEVHHSSGTLSAVKDGVNTLIQIQKGK